MCIFHQPDLPEIDPADVKVGDVVEVSLSGTVTSVGTIGFVLQPDETEEDAPVPFAAATVRLVRRAEPEPDPEQVKALAEVMRSLPPISYDSSEDYARDLVRRGVTVRKEH